MRVLSSAPAVVVLRDATGNVVLGSAPWRQRLQALRSEYVDREIVPIIAAVWQLPLLAPAVAWTFACHHKCLALDHKSTGRVQCTRQSDMLLAVQ